MCLIPSTIVVFLVVLGVDVKVPLSLGHETGRAKEIPQIPAAHKYPVLIDREIVRNTICTREELERLEIPTATNFH